MAKVQSNENADAVYKRDVEDAQRKYPWGAPSPTNMRHTT